MIRLLNWKASTGELTPAQQRDVAQLVQSGREVEAVRQIRRWTDTSLQHAVSMVADVRTAQAPLQAGPGD